MKWKSDRETWEMYDDVANVDREAVDKYERLSGQDNVGTVESTILAGVALEREALEL